MVSAFWVKIFAYIPCKIIYYIYIYILVKSDFLFVTSRTLLSHLCMVVVAEIFG